MAAVLFIYTDFYTLFCIHNGIRYTCAMYVFTYLLFVKFVISFASSADMLEQCGCMVSLVQSDHVQVTCNFKCFRYD